MRAATRRAAVPSNTAAEESREEATTEAEEPSKAPKPPSAKRLLIALGVALVALCLLAAHGEPAELETVRREVVSAAVHKRMKQPPPFHYDAPAGAHSSVAASATAATTTATATVAAAADASLLPRALRSPWLPTPAAPSEIAAAQRAHTSLGLRSMGGAAGDAFLIGVRPSTGTLEYVSPVSMPTFSYMLPINDPTVMVHWANSGRVPRPLDRSAEGFHHLGDVTMRVRWLGADGSLRGGYSTHSTVSRTPPLATAGASALNVAPSGRSASLDATPCLTPKLPGLSMRREVRVEGPEVVLSITLTNGDTSRPLEIGALGLSMPTNQMFTGRSLPQARTRAAAAARHRGPSARGLTCLGLPRGLAWLDLDLT
jgi:hypothetical protein